MRVAELQNAASSIGNKTAVKTLDQMRPGETGVIRSIDGSGPVLQRLLEIGLMEGEAVKVLAWAPLGDPMEIRVRGFELSLRKRDAALVGVDTIAS